ncbi:hypothetical protein AB0F91_43595 [Amycolatopsis sp. NPDC023774]|uniref:hypothetical protein n=1 Tax=Amycolatopsis sp. NPDC023774 TaxID=3155015 RepID=UPI0033D4FA85
MDTGSGYPVIRFGYRELSENIPYQIRPGASAARSATADFKPAPAVQANKPASATSSMLFPLKCTCWVDTILVSAASRPARTLAARNMTRTTGPMKGRMPHEQR